ncbi:ribosomal N-lysine methyltransferase [Aspergillus sclerotioniger CBS 115572]|uniref:Ribosomal N-lysine methyltransferase n=1 Tax=Aspergillus sclerotioniger CBS 115572 TaxID=1450535 RepID=A0A317WV92_9EURO|nr:ribosomal N-lysine methyltransferase [Aspergillus sclerotioniger CBS 115572]PWY90273.1 ribosomal N-lysine methyltransferase [Aspergillus sclerotioniger CBS 115572]
MEDSPGAEHLAFMQWAESAGIKIKGITPARFPGRRLGMKATRTIKNNEIMLTVPVNLMLTIDSIPSSFTSQFPSGTSIHGILAAFLTHADPALLKDVDPWRKVWPSFDEFEDSMPVLWPEHLRVSNSSYGASSSSPSSSSKKVLLPPSISGEWNSFSKEPVGADYDTRYQNLLSQQETRLQDAWAHVVTVYPDTQWKTFAYYWCIINSRSFYYVSPGKDEPEDWNDAIGMVPFADYFNHDDEADCDVTFDGKKYTFRATRRYEKDEEIFMSYGSHSNDFLLVEYGFFLPTNPSDTIYLDDIIFQDLTTAQKKELAAQEIFGNYTLPLPPSTKYSPSGPPSPIHFAAALKYLSRRDWRNYISGRSSHGVDEKKLAGIIRGWVEKYLSECVVTIGIIEGMLDRKDHLDGDGDGDGIGEKIGSRAWEREKLRMLLERWGQIRRLCEGVIEGLK